MLTVKAAMVAAGGVVEGCARFDVLARNRREEVERATRCDWPARLSARNRPSSLSQSARISEQKISDIEIRSGNESKRPTVGINNARVGGDEHHEAVFGLIRL